jgi:hypothetical protein
MNLQVLREPTILHAQPLVVVGAVVVLVSLRAVLHRVRRPEVFADLTFTTPGSGFYVRRVEEHSAIS